MIISMPDSSGEHDHRGVDPDLGEVKFRADRGGGPGGQNRNKRSTRAVITWDFENSDRLTPEQKERLRTHPDMTGRLTREGFIQVRAEGSRSQAANREEALMRLKELVREALEPVKERIPTRVPGQEKRRRLEAKRRRASLKQGRRQDSEDKSDL